MKSYCDEAHAASALHLLLGGDAGTLETSSIEWDLFLRLCKANGVLVRVAHAVEGSDLDPPPFFTEAVSQEQRRVNTQIDAIRQISRACTEKGIDFIFAKAFHNYPDAGRDIDLFVPWFSDKVDTQILEGLKATRGRRSLGSLIAGTINYAIDGCDSLLEIHHGRIGYLGENSFYIETLVKNGRHVEMGGHMLLTPSVEDQIVLQAMQKVYGRLYIRLSDIVCAVSALRRYDPDWDYIINTSKRLGIFWGLCCYVNYVDQIHFKLFDSSLIPPGLREDLVPGGWGRLDFRNGLYRLPGARVIGKAYLNKFKALLLSGNFKGASRLSMLPLIAVAGSFRKVKQTAFN